MKTPHFSSFVEGPGGDGGDDSAGQPRKGALTWAGWEARCAADSQFVYKVCVEQFIGVTSAVLGDMSSRPYWVKNILAIVGLSYSY
jgi:hypothetical protein